MGKRIVRLAPTLIALTVVIAAALAQAMRPPAFERLEAWLFDQYQVISPRPFDPDGVVRIVDIDEASLGVLGQWPWPRTYIAEMIERVSAAGAAVIAFDIVFSEPDRTSPRFAAETWTRFASASDAPDRDALEALSELRDHDAAFAAAIARTPIVLGAILSSEADGAPPQKAGVSYLGTPPTDALVAFDGAIANLPELSGPALGVGSLSLVRVGGSTVRSVPVFARVGDQLVPTLSVEALRVAQRAGSYVLAATDGGGEVELGGETKVASARVGALVLPLEPDGAFRVRFAGAQPTRRISAAAVLAGDELAPALAPEFEGRIVLVGAGAAGLRDLVATPLSASVPGVEVHAEIIEQAVEQIFLTRPDEARGLEQAATLLAGVMVCALLAFNLPILAMGAVAATAVGAAIGSWHAFTAFSLLVNPIAPVVATGGGYLAAMLYNYFVAERSRREVTNQFKHFVSPDVIDEIASDPEKHLTPFGDQRDLSVMFIDVRGFSTVTEKMSPEEVIAFINDILTPLTDVIIDHEGTVDKYMGDAIMAFWNAPRLTENMEGKAVGAALAALEALDGVNARFAERGVKPVRIAIGINTGRCSVGNMGSTRRLSYSCVGDPVNLAARLEGLTRRYDLDCLVGQRTATTATGFAMVPVDLVAVKGRVQPEPIWTIAGDAALAETDAFKEATARLAAARSAFLAREWDAAERLFQELAAVDRVGLFNAKGVAIDYLDRVAAYRDAPPPPDWDGVLVMVHK